MFSDVTLKQFSVYLFSLFDNYVFISTAVMQVVCSIGIQLGTRKRKLEIVVLWTTMQILVNCMIDWMKCTTCELELLWMQSKTAF